MMYDNMSEAEYMEMNEMHSYDYNDYDNHKFYADKSKSFKMIDGKKYYKCIKCHKYKLKDEFYKDKRVPCGIRDKCKICYNENRKK